MGHQSGVASWLLPRQPSRQWLGCPRSAAFRHGRGGGDLLLQDLTEFPRQAVGDALAADFGTATSWNWMEGNAFGFELRDPIPGWPEPDVVEFWEQSGLGFHPLLRWFARTGCSSPMSTARVPRAIAPERCFAALRACMGTTGMDQQPPSHTC